MSICFNHQLPFLSVLTAGTDGISHPSFFVLSERLGLYLTVVTTLQRVKQTITEHRLVDRGQSVLVALSGGPDSVALMHLLTRLRKSMKLTLGAVYVNHQMRPRTSRKEETFCQRLCDDLGVTLTIVREDVPALAKKRGTGLEETAREVRYDVFDRLAGAQSYDRVALGHHADDQVETILFRLIRGTGPSGLTGMPIKRGRIIRPLLDLTRVEIMDYLRANSLSWCEDASNRSIRFKRNWIRHRLLPEIRRHLNPRADSAILALADTLGVEDEFLEAIVHRSVRKAVTISPGGKIGLDLTTFSRYPEWVRRRLLRRCLKVSWATGQRPDRDTIRRLDRLALAGSGSVSLTGRMQAAVAGGKLYLWPRRRQTVRVKYEPGRRLDLDWPEVAFSGRVVSRDRMTMSRKPASRRIWLDWGRLKPPLEIRTARPGDRFRPLGMKGHKKVGDFLTDRKVARPLRDEVLLLCDRAGPVWVVGQEIADRVKIETQTRRILTVAVTVRKKAGRTAV